MPISFLFGILLASVSAGNQCLSFAKTSKFKLMDNYDALDLFYGRSFNFFTDSDPTHGYVEYVDRKTALEAGMLKLNPDNTVRFGVSRKNIVPMSIRIESKKLYTGGLFVYDVHHMPSGCGTWPALWMYGDPWPTKGEIDLMESLNGVGENVMTLHSSENCSVPEFPGMMNTDCNHQNAWLGCGIKTNKPNSIGESFNKVQGGVFAAHWDAREDGSIQIWQFERSQIPKDLSQGSPNPASWGTPQAYFKISKKTGCSSDHFKEMKLVVNLTFCGDAAGNVFKFHCPSKAGQIEDSVKSCNAYIGSPEADLSEAFFIIKSIKVYKEVQ